MEVVASPVIYNNLLLLSADGANNPKLYALNKNDGTVRWEVNRDSNAKKSFPFVPLQLFSGRKTSYSKPSK